MVAIKQALIDNQKKKIKDDPDLLPENKKLILEFQRYLELQDYSNQRQYKYLIRLPILSEQLAVPFTEASKEDIERLVLWLNQRDDITDTTKLDYKILLKRFYKWIGNGEYPECVKFISTTEKNNNGKLPEDLLTEKDVKKLLQAADHPRNRAFIAMLWETGARVSELMDLKVGSLEDYKYGMKCVVKGKTGARRRMLIQSVPYLNDWLKTHPHREKDAPLWVNVGTRNNGQVMEYRALLKMLNETAKKAKVSKPVNPHHFRHSRATYMANHFTEAQMCEWFGWVQGSDVPARYVHLSGRDIDSAYARMYGLKEEEEEGLEVEFITCPRCGYDNGPTMQYCGRCGMALNMEAALEAEDKDKQVGISLLQTIQNNPQAAQEMMTSMVQILARHNPELAEAVEEEKNTG